MRGSEAADRVSTLISSQGLRAPAAVITAAGQRFAAGMLLASLLPFPVFALLHHAVPLDPVADATYRALVLVSSGHIGLSSLFLLDRRYRAHLCAHKRVYFGQIALVVLFCVIGYALLGTVFVAATTLIYMAWNAVHYARQNWGILVLTARGTRASPPSSQAPPSQEPSSLEWYACHAAALGGFIGVLPNLVHPDYAPPGLRTAGLALLLAVLALSAIVAARQARNGAHPLRLGMTMAIGMFFLPIYLFGPVIGFVATAAAHAAQYYIIMGIIAADRRQGSPSRRVAGVAMVVLALMGILFFIPQSNGASLPMPPDAVFLAINVLIVWHFLLDAGVWRLSQPFQRQAVRESFPFLFPGGNGRLPL